MAKIQRVLGEGFRGESPFVTLDASWDHILQHRLHHFRNFKGEETVVLHMFNHFDYSHIHLHNELDSH